jgi:hypothetical protein
MLTARPAEANGSSAVLPGRQSSGTVAVTGAPVSVMP